MYTYTDDRSASWSNHPVRGTKRSAYKSRGHRSAPRRRRGRLLSVVVTPVVIIIITTIVISVIIAICYTIL